ncbi:ABC transporter substrate-binding protein [Enterococcus sp. LJL98]
MKLSKKMITGLTTLGLTLLLAACGTGGTSGKDESSQDTKAKGALTVWAWDPKFNIAAFETAQAFYQEEHPDFQLNIVENAQADIVQKLNTSLSSGTTKGLPNIVLIEDYRAKSFLDAYPDAFYPLTDLLDADQFMSYKVDATSSNQVHYAIPFDSGVTGLYLRQSIIEEAGLTTADFENITWDEFRELGKIVKEKTGKAMFSNDMNDLGLLRVMMQSSGAWYSGEDGATPTFEGNASLAKGFEDIKAMLDDGVMATHNGWDQLLANFNNGEVAAVVQGNWITPSVTAESDQAGDWRIVPIPRQDGVTNATNASNLGGSSVYVLNIDGKEKAAKFVSETFGSSTAFYEKLITEIGALGSYAPASETPAYQATVPFFGDQAINVQFMDWATQIPSVNFGKNTYAFEDLAKVALQDYLNGSDLTTVLSQTQKTAETQVK